MADDPNTLYIDAATFQRPLEDLVITITNKVEREGDKILTTPPYVFTDVAVLLRQTTYTYDLLFYLNADTRRNEDPDWRQGYSFASLSLIRCMIDCLYNVTALLDNPTLRGPIFRGSGYRQALESLDEDEKRYAGDERWDEAIAKHRKNLSFDMRINGFDDDQVRNTQFWPTLSAYLRVKKGAPLTPHQEFLKSLTYGFWREYSAVSHGVMSGLMKTAPFYLSDRTAHEKRGELKEYGWRLMTLHLSRAAAILICMITELQAYFHFNGANINSRIHKVWDALLPVYEIKELYDARYSRFMADKGI